MRVAVILVMANALLPRPVSWKSFDGIDQVRTVSSEIRVKVWASIGTLQYNIVKFQELAEVTKPRVDDWEPSYLLW